MNSFKRREAISLICLALVLIGALVHGGTIESGVEVLPMATRNPDVAQTYAPRNVSLGAQCFGLRLNRTEFTDPASTVEFRVQASFDGGVTWTDPQTGEPVRQLRLETKGGPYVVNGVTQDYSFGFLDLPEPANASRQLRGGYRVTGAPARFSLDVRLRDAPCRE